MGMSSRINLATVALLLNISLPLLAAGAEDTEKMAITSEPTKCYEMVWGSEEKKQEGLGLTAGQAVTLCSGTTNAATVVRCFVEAWAHPQNGGLGLTAGQAITLCKTNSLQ